MVPKSGMIQGTKREHFQFISQLAISLEDILQLSTALALTSRSRGGTGKIKTIYKINPNFEPGTFLTLFFAKTSDISESVLNPFLTQYNTSNKYPVF